MRRDHESTVRDLKDRMRQLAINRCVEVDRLLFAGAPDIDSAVRLEAVPLQRVQAAALRGALLRFLLAYAKQTGRAHISRRVMMGNLLLATMDRKFDLHEHLHLDIFHASIAIDQIAKLSAASICNHTASVAVQTEAPGTGPHKSAPSRPAQSPRSLSSKRRGPQRAARNSDIKYFSTDRSTQSRSPGSAAGRLPLEVQVDVSDFQASFVLQHIEVPALQPLCVDRRLIV